MTRKSPLPEVITQYSLAYVIRQLYSYAVCLVLKSMQKLWILDTVLNLIRNWASTLAVYLFMLLLQLQYYERVSAHGCWILFTNVRKQ